ncbi:hypothetical protein SAMN06265379_101124 [Saccharicrinis carchari]|uniref:Phosphate-selective porin O and P n=1 Tax=Saccharicrinis carchari TaxID=1168039 RepID=A0A521AG34_SACCC|nr:hypothetical protein [Saccharicrinis carchari]SMO33774.1 hypothetical protein SAMN06265379_101124 [Saccharicrinis carchari]
MKTIFLFMALTACSIVMRAQVADNQNQYFNAAEKMLQTEGNLQVGGYAEVHYNQPLSSAVKSNGKLDVHRVVMLFGYQFNERTQFITEIEFEHVSEVYIEQAFLQYKINNALNLRAGLILTPMGIINEYHEPNTFNGVERPHIDKLIAPTTWREIGVGFTGVVVPANMRYQAYLMNGFNGFNGAGKFRGKDGLRKGRQKGAESYISSPNFTAKVEYFGIRGLNLGLSGYVGKSQSTLYDGINKDDVNALAVADSSVINMAMIGADFRYSRSGLSVKGQFYYNSLGNTNEYNVFTAKDGKNNDLGKSMIGYYAEVGYNVFNTVEEVKTELIPFIRLEKYDTQNSLEKGIVRNKAYAANVITTGLTWKVAPNAAFKSDVQFVKTEADNKAKASFNAGFGIMF